MSGVWPFICVSLFGSLSCVMLFLYEGLAHLSWVCFWKVCDVSNGVDFSKSHWNSAVWDPRLEPQPRVLAVFSQAEADTRSLICRVDAEPHTAYSLVFNRQHPVSLLLWFKSLYLPSGVQAGVVPTPAAGWAHGSSPPVRASVPQSP